ncbi:hypothetical protein FB45DRAFT_909389 [Roridomyces roridus]|uniref:F-box domain-containing protein n=1 Tax=Roridomyces roridus TaxID=1738132 RepID=A0AAD7FR43_9AGAR|nr:hypothetical protein FB45DRAFT_909389 [Roridomyces roridus]
MSGPITGYTPFASRLDTNSCPTAEEAVEIKAFLAEPLLQLKCLDNKIADMQQALNKLSKERGSLQSFIHSHQALLSPIRRIPTDIMREIFLACLPTHRNCVMDAGEAPLLLGRVCSAWRTLSLQTPPLWASLHIVDPGQHWSEEQSEWGVSQVALDHPRAALVAEAARRWLQRSGRCPISVSWHLQDATAARPWCSNSRSVAGIILPLASRWQHIEFTIDASVCQELAQLGTADVPELKSVALRYSPGGSFIAWDTLLFLAGAKLRIATVTGFGLVVSQLPIQWSQLTALREEGTRIPLDSALLIISRCVNLRSLALMFAEVPMTGQLPFVDHHLLESLHLSGHANTSAGFMHQINVPQLKDFALVTEMADNWDEPWEETYRAPFPEPALLEFIATLPLLESLSLTTGQIIPSSATKILLQLPPSLRRIHIDADCDHPSSWPYMDASLRGDLLASLTFINAGSTMPLPILRVLDIAIVGKEFITDATLNHFITARASTLQRVKINFARPMQGDLRDALSPLIENGLDFAVTYVAADIYRYSPWEGLPDAPKAVLE